MEVPTTRKLFLVGSDGDCCFRSRKNDARAPLAIPPRSRCLLRKLREGCWGRGRRGRRSWGRCVMRAPRSFVRRDACIFVSDAEMPHTSFRSRSLSDATVTTDKSKRPSSETCVVALHAFSRQCGWSHRARRRDERAVIAFTLCPRREHRCRECAGLDPLCDEFHGSKGFQSESTTTQDAWGGAEDRWIIRLCGRLNRSGRQDSRFLTLNADSRCPSDPYVSKTILALTPSAFDAQHFPPSQAQMVNRIIGARATR